MSKAQQSISTQNVGWFHKYRTLIISIVVFLLLDLVVLGINYYQSFVTEKAAREIALATRQGDLVQQITKNTIDLTLAAERLVNTSEYGGIDNVKFKENFKQYEQLNTSVEQFGSVLEAFEKGGEIIDANGNKIWQDALHLPEIQHNIDSSVAIWKPFSGLVNNFIADYNANNLRLDTVQFTGDYARTYNARLQNDMQLISQALQKRAEKAAAQSRWIQVMGIIAAFLVFTFIVFRALRSLLQSDKALIKAQKETADIMRTVKEGLFLVDENYVISNEYSAELTSIIKRKDIGGKTLGKLLKDIIPASEIETVEEFIEQLFNTKVVQNLISELNPLNRIQVYLPDDRGQTQSCYLSFNFSRVYEGRNISRVLVSVSDITESVLLEEQLAKEQQKHDEELELLSSVLHVNSNTLDGFLKHANNSAQRINDVLRQQDSSSSALYSKVDAIFREVHGLKGEASALKIANYVSLMKLLEDKLKAMREIPNLTGNDFLSLAMELESMLALNEKIINLHNRLRHNNEETLASAGQSNGIDTAFFVQFAQDIADRHHKKVQVDCHGFSDVILSDDQYGIVKDIVIQMLRNALVHGIEEQQVREARHKDAQGKIMLILSRADNNQVAISVRDDGNGINFEGLRQKAIQKRGLSLTEGANLTHQDLLRFMMSPGVSTADGVNEDAGQGVGFDLIVERIKQLKGRIAINSKEGQFTHFKITFPV